MTETKGDLISRSKLIEDFKTRLTKCNGWIEKAKDKETKIRASAVKSYICEVIMTLEKAEAVEPFEPDYVGAERLKARQRGYEDGYHNGLEIGKTLNPKIKQGEWIKHYKGQINSFCKDCNYEVGRKTNFCPNCGAKMFNSEGATNG